MSAFDTDDYLEGMPDAESLKGDSASAEHGSRESQESDKQAQSTGQAQPTGTAKPAGQAESTKQSVNDNASPDHKDSPQSSSDDSQSQQDQSDQAQESSSAEQTTESEEDNLTPLGKAKKEAADYLEALQRERAQFVNFRNRATKEQDTFRQHGITDVLTALLPALDDIDRIREHGGLDDSFEAVANKIDKTFEKFGVEKFGQKGEDFDPTKHEAILHKPDPAAKKETVDTVVEAGYKIGDRVVRAARVVVSSPQQ